MCCGSSYWDCNWRLYIFWNSNIKLIQLTCHYVYQFCLVGHSQSSDSHLSLSRINIINICKYIILYMYIHVYVHNLQWWNKLFSTLRLGVLQTHCIVSSMLANDTEWLNWNEQTAHQQGNNTDPPHIETAWDSLLVKLSCRTCLEIWNPPWLAKEGRPFFLAIRKAKNLAFTSSQKLSACKILHVVCAENL